MGKNLIAKEEHKANVMLEQQGMEGMHFWAHCALAYL